jgi:hypothetical protein
LDHEGRPGFGRGQSLNARARPSGRDTNIRGAFVSREAFFGEAKSERCRYTVRLFKAASS